LKLVGDFFADIIVDAKIILELKAVQSLNSVAEAQLLNYLSISGLSVGYIFNFRNTSLSWKRMVMDACASRERSERPAMGNG